MTSSKLPLHKKISLPVKSIKKFSWAVGVNIDELTELARDAKRYYYPYLDKKGSKPRLIDQPTGRLKIIQKKINSGILKLFDFPKYIIGGIKNRGLDDHLSLHIKKSIVVTLDLKGFYPNITNKQVYVAWVKQFGAYADTARIATMLTTYNGHLPTGAPTSTILANIILLPVLEDIRVMAAKHGFEMSQFVDDSALSGKELPKNLISEICKLLSRSRFKINREKIKVMPSSGPQLITKRIVNRKASIKKSEMSRLRSAVHELQSIPKDDPRYKKLLESIMGRISAAKIYHPKKANALLKTIQHN